MQPDSQSAASTCPYCGWLGWTVAKYGRVTHKEACPHRSDRWHQGDTKASAAQGRCRSGRHIFEPFTPSDDLGGGAQRCECGKLLIDRTLGGGRVVEINGPDFVGPSRSRIGRIFA